ncbi:MAG: hypothetical protein GQ569_05860 [Methylococcaceae bacterium]|nr:hypothetical protein [Methylococcaceae bacterium]
MNKLLLLTMVLCLTACGGSKTRLRLEPNEMVVFPNGTVFGGASAEQASELAKILVQAYNSPTIGGNKATARYALKLLEVMSKRHGSGEITLFFRKGSSQIEDNPSEYHRLVRFLDFLARESHGRRVLLVSIGSSSDQGDEIKNILLSVARSKSPVNSIKKYLVNTPHYIYKAYGTRKTDLNTVDIDEELTPKQIESYRHVRIIAAFEKNDLPLLPQ